MYFLCDFVHVRIIHFMDHLKYCIENDTTRYIAYSICLAM